MGKVKAHVYDYFEEYQLVQIDVNEDVEVVLESGEKVKGHLQETFSEYREVGIDVDDIVDVEVSANIAREVICDGFGHVCGQDCSTCIFWNMDKLEDYFERRKKLSQLRHKRTNTDEQGQSRTVRDERNHPAVSNGTPPQRGIKKENKPEE